MSCYASPKSHKKKKNHKYYKAVRLLQGSLNWLQYTLKKKHLLRARALAELRFK